MQQHHSLQKTITCHPYQPKKDPSLLELFFKKGVFRNFAKFTGKHLRQSICFNKVDGLGPATLLKKRLWHRCFPVNFANFLNFQNTFFMEHLWWLLLYKYNDCFKFEEKEHLNQEVSLVKEFILGQLYVIKKSVEDIRSETVAPDNLELIEAIKEEIRYLRNKNLTKIYIINILTEKQTVETKSTSRIHQLDKQTQEEVTLETRPQEETISKNTNNGSI